MDVPDKYRTLLNRVEEMGKHCDDQRLVIHRALGRMKKLVPEQRGVKELVANLPVLFHFLTSEHPEAGNPFEERRLANIARGAILYFLKQNDAIPDEGLQNGLVDDAWVVKFAAEEIVRIFPSFTPFQNDRLSPEARQEAESQLMDLAGTPCVAPDALINEARIKMEEVGKISGHPFTTALLKHTEALTAFLIGYTSKPGYNPNDYSYRIAIGALRYLVKENDVISDWIGPRGYLDDAFVLETAWNLFEKNRPKD